MKTSIKLLSLLGATCVVAFAGIAPASAGTKPCCRNDGQYFNSSPSTCRHNGGRVVQQEYCQQNYDYNYNGNYNGYNICTLRHSKTQAESHNRKRNNYRPN